MLCWNWASSEWQRQGIHLETQTCLVIGNIASHHLAQPYGLKCAMQNCLCQHFTHKALLQPGAESGKAGFPQESEGLVLFLISRGSMENSSTNIRRQGTEKVLLSTIPCIPSGTELSPDGQIRHHSSVSAEKYPYPHQGLPDFPMQALSEYSCTSDIISLKSISS